METILFIEAITLFGVFIIGSMFWVTTEIWSTIKKYKRKNFDNF